MKQNIVTLDVREDIRNGREPFSRIMRTVAGLGSDEKLLLIAPFEPVPLLRVLKSQGFEHSASRTASGDCEVQSRRRAAWSVALLNAGLAGSFLTILLRSPWKLAFGLMVVAALAIYGLELAAVLRAKKRRELDWGIKYFLTAIVLLLPVSILAAFLSSPGVPLTPFTGQLENAYGFFGLIGVVSFAIIGMLYKVIPFLVWYRSYSRQIGLAQVPSLADLYSARLQAAGYWSYLAGLAATSAAILTANPTVVRCGCSLLVMSVVAFALNVSTMLSHLARPRLRPLASQHHHPGGMLENSPAFQRRDSRWIGPSPAGTAEISRLSRPYGTYPPQISNPASKRRATAVCPSGTETASSTSNPCSVSCGAWLFRHHFLAWRALARARSSRAFSTGRRPPSCS